MSIAIYRDQYLYIGVNIYILYQSIRDKDCPHRYAIRVKRITNTMNGRKDISLVNL